MRETTGVRLLVQVTATVNLTASEFGLDRDVSRAKEARAQGTPNSII